MASDALCNIVDNHLILELVLLRVPSPTCLVRAAATCKLWRRVIADGGFLQLYRSLHLPAASGYYFNKIDRSPTGDFLNMSPSFIPRTMAIQTIDTKYLSLDFLPKGPEYWKILDSRGSLLLMKNLLDDPNFFPDMLVVCEPLTRRYKIISAPPNFEYPCKVYRCYLVDSCNADEAGRCIGMSNFRVLCEVDHLINSNWIVHAAIFTVAGHAGTWSENVIDEKVPQNLRQKRFFGRAGESWHFVVGERAIVTFDGHTGEHSSFLLPTNEDWPDHIWNNPIYITDGRDGKPRIFSAVDNIMSVYGRLDKDWVLEKKVALQEATRGLPGYKPSFFNQPLFVSTWGPGFATLIALSRDIIWLFSIDLETMEVSPASAEDWVPETLFRYELPCPPVFRSCLDTTQS